MLRAGLFLVASLLLSSSGGGEARSVDWSDDAILKTWPSLLPAGWQVRAAGSSLVVERTDPIKILFENKINAPLERESARQRSERIQRLGQADKASLTFSLVTKRQPKELWADVTKLPTYLSTNFELRLTSRLGIEDEFHSVDPPEVAGELIKVQKTLAESLAVVLSPGKHLSDYEGQTVVIVGNKSTLMNQHVVANPPDTKFSEYVDWGDYQTIAYSTAALPGTGPWELTGLVMAVGNEPKSPFVKDSIREFHLRVTGVRGL